MDKQSTILHQLSIVWAEHPSWTLGKLLSVLLSMEHIEPRLMYMSDEEFFKRTLHITKDSAGFRIKKLPVKSQYKASELIAHLDDFVKHLNELKEQAIQTDRFEMVLAYALFIDEMMYMRGHLEGKM